MELRRRELLKLGLFGSAALMLPVERVARTKLAVNNRIPASQLPKPFTAAFQVPPIAVPVQSTETTDIYSLVQQQKSVDILPGLKTDIWGYNGVTPGPTIKVAQGRETIVRQANALPGLHPTLRYKPWTSTHLHGSASKPQYDGYASDVTNPGQFKDYHYPNVQEARTLWYHDHGVHFTAPNAYMGLAAMYILHDPFELSLPLPRDRYDVPIVIKDALFTSTGALIFDDHGGSGLFGDVILVNGVPWPAMKVERRKYRFRILNASISRSYNLALDTTGVVMAFDVASDATDKTNNSVPNPLNPDNPVMKLEPSMATKTRQLDFVRKSGLWSVNGLTWEDVINSGFKDVVANPGVNDVEIWELRNKSGGWFHPVHIHLVDFRILDRNGQPPHAYELGGKDTVYVGEGETVRVIARFGPHAGRYMIHCHNLVHEDHDMMVQYEVGTGGDDPITADPAGQSPGPPL